jgi:membrane-anchored protein YejM (alkaline phosphatase superfamily)
MAFFNSGVDNDGKESFKVSSRLWIFFAVAVPLTVLVSGVYQYWRREKERRMELRHTQNDDIETGSL